VFLIFIQVISCLYCLSSNSKLLSKSNVNQVNADNKPADAPTSKILWEGWVKYFHFETAGTIQRPTQFFLNNAFKSQKVLKDQLMQKDEKGLYNNITTKHSFFLRLLSNSINILSEKNLNFSKTVETLNIDVIKPLDPSEPLKGPIKDLGTFNEGSCISIATLVPIAFNKDFLPIKKDANSRAENWIICFEDADQKEKMYTTLMTYKLLRQKEQNIELVLREAGVGFVEPTTPKFERYQGSDAKPEIDGYLNLVQDWTGCTLKCGGGESFQQWRCIPPKQGGRPCSGELIRKKKCNTNPCPGVSISKEDEKAKDNKEDPVTFKPIFKSMPFIDRPQQNIPCVIRENDVLFEKFDADSGYTVKVPGRILMNNRTISVFEDSSYENAVFSFNLDKSNLIPFADDYCCFFVQSENKRNKICALSDCGTKSEPKFLDSWKYSFSLFKNKCFNKFATDVLPVPKEDQPKPAENSPTMAAMNIEEDEVDEREKIIEQNLNEDTQLSLENKVSKVQQSALKAITRELNLEERLKREEMMKAKEETKVLMKKMNFEKAKKEKLEDAIEEKENQDVKLKQQRQIVNEGDNIVRETESMINKKRNALKRKIMEIRKTTERRKRLIENKINLIRGKMTQEIVLANKIGNIDTCKNAKAKQSDINGYCDDFIINDFQKNKDCKVMENFCYICCETEFGAVQYSNRAKCYDMCDNGEKEAKKLEEPRGEWIWKVNNQE